MKLCLLQSSVCMQEYAKEEHQFPEDEQRTLQHYAIYLFQVDVSLNIAAQSIAQSFPGRLYWSCRTAGPGDHNNEDKFSPDCSTPEALHITPSVP